MLLIAWFPIRSIQCKPGFENSRERWFAPSWTDTMVNRVQKTAIAIEAGKRIYLAECVVCHDRNGKGEGESGFGLKTPPGDLTDEFNCMQSDGALYWKIEQGKGQMPSYAAKTSDLQRWQLVQYIRSLQKVAGAGQRKASKK